MVFNPGNKQSGDLLKSEDWNAAMKEIQRLGQAKVNRNGADTLTGPLTIADALNVTGNVGIGTTKPTSEKLEVAGNVKITGARLKNANGWGIIETNQTDWLRINPDQNYPAIALYKAVGINNGGLAVGELTQQPQGVLKVTQSAYLATLGGNVGIGTTDPKAKLTVVGTVMISDGTGYAPAQNYMASGSLTIGSTNSNYGGGVNQWNNNTAGLLLETKANTEIAVHDAGLRLASLMYYEGEDINRITIGRNMGWGEINTVSINGNVGIGTTAPKAKLHIDKGRVDITASDATGGGGNRFDGLIAPTAELYKRSQLVLSSGYSDLVIASSQGNDNHGSTLTFATYNPANANDYRKWVINQGNWGARRQFLEFGYSDSNGKDNPHLNINNTETVMTLDGVNKRVGIGTRSPEAKLDVDGDAMLGYETNLSNFGSPLKSGFYQNAGVEIPGDVPDTSHGWTHLITARHSNKQNNYQLQIAAAYSSNDRLFFRKIEAGLEVSNPIWHEVATRGTNTFLGTQTLQSNLITTGAIMPSVGNASNKGIMFPTDAFGGGGDAAWMRYYARSAEACTLEIGISNDGDDHIALMPSGNVGIGIHNPQAKLDIAGGLRIRDTSTNGNWMNIYFESGNQTIVFYHQNGLGQFMRQDGNWTRNSDASLKENVSELQGILDKVIQLKPVSFLWKGTQMSDIGFVAQDVEQVFPEIVSSRKSEQEGGREIKGLPYSHFGIIAIAAIKEMKKYYDQKIEALEKKTE